MCDYCVEIDWPGEVFCINKGEKPYMSDYCVETDLNGEVFCTNTEALLSVDKDCLRETHTKKVVQV